MTLPKKKNLKTGSKISLIVLLLSIVRQFLSIYQTKHQLTSPLIPESAVLTIIKPFIFCAFITTVISVAGLILYFYERYLFVIILAGLTIVWQEVYPYWAY
jgi:hypothetical protein